VLTIKDFGDLRANAMQSNVAVVSKSASSRALCFASFFLQGYSVRMDISGGNMGTFSKAEIARELLRCGPV